MLKSNFALWYCIDQFSLFKLNFRQLILNNFCQELVIKSFRSDREVDYRKFNENLWSKSRICQFSKQINFDIGVDLYSTFTESNKEPIICILKLFSKQTIQWGIKRRFYQFYKQRIFHSDCILDNFKNIFVVHLDVHQLISFFVTFQPFTGL